MKAPYISVVVPAFQKEKTIKSVLVGVHNILTELGKPFEILCIVNGCTDKTLEEALDTQSLYPKIHVINLGNSQGKGLAVRHGFKLASGQIVVFIDSGGKINPNILPNMISLIGKGYDLVIGSKFLANSKVAFTPLRSLYSYGFRLLVKLLFNLTVSDTQVGIKAFSKQVVAAILPQLSLDGYAFDVELLVEATRKGFIKIAEVPVEVNYKTGTSSSSKLSSAAMMFIDIIKLYFRTWNI